MNLNPPWSAMYVIVAYPSPYLALSNTFAQVSYLNQMSNNKNAWHILQTIKMLGISFRWQVSTCVKFSLLLKYMQPAQM